jgi:hypothetical protein|tara:strand:- start:632 stop:916 length:285 start_codon:yes stop_codon:yes gene_type:complete
MAGMNGKKLSLGNSLFTSRPERGRVGPFAFFAGIWAPGGGAPVVLTEPGVREFEEAHHWPPIILDAQTIHCCNGPEPQDCYSIKALVQKRLSSN